jgi:hypothetical protein
MLTLRGKSTVAWIVLIAIVYSAATPLLSALRDGEQTRYFGMLCTLAGIKAAPGQPAVPSGSGGSRQQHCIFCISGAWQPPLEVSLAVPVPEATAGAAPHAVADVVLSTAASLQPLSPRAPPRFA